MSDGVMTLLASSIGPILMGGDSPAAGAHMLNGALPHYNVYQCADGGWISIGSLEPHFFVNLCKALGCEQFIPHQYDGTKRAEIKDYFTKAFKTKSRDEWFRILSETDICAGPVYSLREALDDPHNRARGMLIEVEHPTLGKIPHLGIGTKLSDTPGQVRSTAPLPGQHTDEVLSSIGYDQAAVTALRERGIVG
jgi:crotonobetainyl-CoA:carnitine CoA-transferase CaiB-like acyl-CoA transferase